jgi:serine/threonine protein kinase
MSQIPEKAWQQRYELRQTLNANPQGPTYLAWDREATCEVVIKELHLSTLDDWKRLELFEREARTLAHLQHPQVPQLREFFRNPEGTALYLVVEKVAGQSLLARLEAGWRPSEAQVCDLATQLLEILVYLHGLHPPVVHRDIKPSNILLDERDQAYLVDFGAAQQMLHPEGGRTVVGTFGYMAPEQFGGQASPASDVYGVGATLLHVLSGRIPSDIPQQDLRFQFQPYVNGSPALVSWLERLLEPAPAQRFASAQAALDALRAVRQGRVVPPVAAVAATTKRQPWLRWGVAAVVVLGLGAGYLTLRPQAVPQQQCFQTPLLNMGADSSSEAEAFRQRFRQQFPLPAAWEKVPVPPVTTLDELNALWRCQSIRSGADPVFFKTAWNLILHSPLDDNTVVSSINLMYSAQENYPQAPELLKFALDNYFDFKSPEDWDTSARVVATLTRAYGRLLNKQGNYAEAERWLGRILRERGKEINHPTSQLIYQEYAMALWKLNRGPEALIALDHAIATYGTENWYDKLVALRDQVRASL